MSMADFLENFNTAYGLTRKVARDFETARAMKTEAGRGFTSEQTHRMNALANNPEYTLDMTPDASEVRYVHNSGDASRDEVFRHQPIMGLKYSDRRVAAGDAQGLNLAKMQAAADVIGRYDPEKGLDAWEQVDDARYMNEARGRQRKQWTQEDTSNAMRLAVFNTPREKLMPMVQGMLEPLKLAGGPGVTLEQTRHGYVLAVPTAKGQIQAVDLDYADLMRFAYAGKMAEMGYGEAAATALEEAIGALDARGATGAKTLREFAKAHNDTNEKALRQDNADRTHGLAERRFGLDVQQFRDASARGWAGLALQRERMNQRTAAGGAGRAGAGADKGPTGVSSSTMASWYRQNYSDIAEQNPDLPPQQVQAMAEQLTGQQVLSANQMMQNAYEDDAFRQMGHAASTPEEIEMFVQDGFPIYGDEVLQFVPKDRQAHARQVVQGIRNLKADAYNRNAYAQQEKARRNQRAERERVMGLVPGSREYEDHVRRWNGR